MTNDEKLLYIAMLVEKWSNIKGTTGGYALDVKTEPLYEGCTGFMPVFETREALKKVYPNVEILVVNQTGVYDADNQS